MAEPNLEILKSRGKKELQEIKAKFHEVFERLCKMSKDFRNAIHGPLPVANYFKGYQSPTSMHSLYEILSDWESQKIFDKNASPNLLKEFTLLVNLCRKLHSEYETSVFLFRFRDEKNPEHVIIKWGIATAFPRNFFIPEDRIASLYKVKGKLIERTVWNGEKGGCIKDFTKSKYDCLDEIQIDDLNSPLSKPGNVLTDGFAGMSKFIPTIVKYTNQEGNKKLLISLPENLDVTTFLKGYGTMLTGIHREFYQKRIVAGRPKSKGAKANLILNILEEKFKSYDFGRRPPSINKLAKVASEGLNEKEIKGSSVGYIRSHFIKTFRQFLDAKIRG